MIEFARTKSGEIMRRAVGRHRAVGRPGQPIGASIIEKAEEFSSAVALRDAAREFDTDVIGADDDVALSDGTIGRESFCNRNTERVDEQQCDRSCHEPAEQHVSRKYLGELECNL